MTIILNNIHKNFGDKKILSNINFSINNGEIIALLGPSGSGKTSLLRIIGGLEKADEGFILVNNENISNKPVIKRKIGFVFQHYALFWHMNVFDNISFGLKIKGNIDKDQIYEKVFSLLKLMKLEDFAKRYPAELSGGQQQRVALARSLIIEPEILLLDEPFSAMDQKVRKELRRWLRKLHQEINITTIFVTHDQEEAMELADKIVIMDKGKIIQIDNPEQIYNHPKNSFIYDFLGDYNIFDGIIDHNGVAHIRELIQPIEKKFLPKFSDNLKNAIKSKNWRALFEKKNPYSSEDIKFTDNKNKDLNDVKLFARPHNISISRENLSQKTIKAKLIYINKIFGSVKLELEKNDRSIIYVEINKNLFTELNPKIDEIFYIYPTETQLFNN